MPSKAEGLIPREAFCFFHIPLRYLSLYLYFVSCWWSWMTVRCIFLHFLDVTTWYQFSFCISS
jgi:hypothetical protein